MWRITGFVLEKDGIKFPTSVGSLILTKITKPELDTSRQSFLAARAVHRLHSGS